MNLTKETLDRLYKKQKTMLSTGWIITIGVIALTEVLRLLFKDIVTDRAAFNFIMLIIDILPIIYIVIMTKKLIPSGQSRRLRKVIKVMQQDPISDNTVNMLYRAIGEASKYPEKLRLTGLLVSVYSLRGQYREAFDLLFASDRSGFEKYPDVAMLHFSDIICLYAEVGDNDSALRAYADGKRFFEAASERNYICCTTAFSAMIGVEAAQKNYRKALDLRLILNEYQNLFNSSTGAAQQGTPLNRLINGTVFMDSAELFYLCGDLDNAAKYIDIGGPMLSASPFLTGKANDLSEKIRTALAQRSYQ